MARHVIRIVLLTLVAAPLAADEKNAKGPKGPADGKATPAQGLAAVRQQMLQKFDLNKDGVLSDQEKLAAQEAMRRQGWPAMPLAPGGFAGAEEFSKRFDRDGDGKLSPLEQAAAQAAYQKLRGKGSAGGTPPQIGPALGAPAPAAAIHAEGTAPAEGKGKVSPLVKRFDNDGDGKLSAEEKAAAQAEFKKSGKEKAAEKAKEKAAAKKMAAKP
jgi:hypothetical protein